MFWLRVQFPVQIQKDLCFLVSAVRQAKQHFQCLSELLSSLKQKYYILGGKEPSQISYLSELSIREAHRPQFNTRGRQVHCVLEKDSVLYMSASSCQHRLAAQERDQCLTISIF